MVRVARMQGENFMLVYKLTFAVMSALMIGVVVISPSQAQTQFNPQDDVNNIIAKSLGPINQCYHGMSQSDPCMKSPTAISALIYGGWKAEDRPWTLNFSPNGVFDLSHGTITMTTIGAPKSGKYRIEDPETSYGYPMLYVDMDDGGKYKSEITLYGAGTLLLIEDSGTVTFDRHLSGN
jgi:hypothetical protein